MRKATHYKVSGVVETKPTNLPEGLTIEEVDSYVNEVLEIGPFHFADSAVYNNAVYIREDSSKPSKRHLTKNQTRELRDFLNKILDEVILGILVDRVNDLWFEFEPGLYTYGADVSYSVEVARGRAIDRRKEGTSSLVDKTRSWLESEYGPCTEYKDWEED